MKEPSEPSEPSARQPNPALPSRGPGLAGGGADPDGGSGGSGRRGPEIAGRPADPADPERSSDGTKARDPERRGGEAGGPTVPGPRGAAAAGRASGGCRRWRPRFSLGFLLALLVIVTAVFGWCIPAMVRTSWMSSATCSKCHLRQLGMYLQVYASRYGNDVHYPGIVPPSIPPASAAVAPVPAGPNGAFWSHLWLLPSPASAVVRLPGEHELFTCPAFRKSVGWSSAPGSLDWAGPRLGNRKAFPGGALDESVRADVFVSGDLLGTPEGPNLGHAPRGYPPRWTGLRWDGSVLQREMGEDPVEYARFVAETDALTAPRTR